MPFQMVAHQSASLGGLAARAAAAPESAFDSGTARGP